MSTPQGRSSMDSTPGDHNIRKRVCKACDRCRLKKSKCDGANPCSRCKTDNAICVFGERKKSHDKVYPKGYVEMLEQQQAQLVAGLRELYRRLQAGQGWPGLPLQEAQGGHPLTHDILERLDLLHATGESPSSNYDGFEEDCNRMQQKLIDNGATYMQRRGSVSSDSEHGCHTSSTSSYGTPPTKPLQFRNSPPTPPQHSPFPPPSQLKTEAKPNTQILPSQPYIRTNSGLNPIWTQDSMMDDMTSMEYMTQFDSPMTYEAPAMAFNQYPLGIAASSMGAAYGMGDWPDNTDIDFNNFINPAVSS